MNQNSRASFQIAIIYSERSETKKWWGLKDDFKIFFVNILNFFKVAWDTG